MFAHLFRMPAFYAVAAGLGGTLLVYSFGRESRAAAPAQPAGPPQPVIVELFTSEGCSSCPPADALLKQLGEQQPVPGAVIVPLEEHVDYWNHLGWADPFSAGEFSDRQSDYARVFGSDGVYTPQMIVDGQSELVGSRGHSARETIEKAASLPKLQMTLRLDATSKPAKPTLEIQTQNPHGVPVRDTLELWVAVTEKGLQSNVKAGENSGETLRHAAVVRSLRKFDILRDANAYQKQIEIGVDPNWNRPNLAVVAFLAERGTHKIVGAATISLN